MPSSTSLRLQDLDRSSSEFHDKLAKILLGKDCIDQVEDLSREDLRRLVENLDRVCMPVTSIHFLLNRTIGS